MYIFEAIQPFLVHLDILMKNNYTLDSLREYVSRKLKCILLDKVFFLVAQVWPCNIQIVD